MSTSQVPAKVLPAHPSEEHLRKEAKRLSRDEGIQLAAAQRQLAHDYGYKNWAALIAMVQGMPASGGSNGDDDPSQPAAPPPAQDSGGNLRLPLIALRELVAFPHVSYPIFVGRSKSIAAVSSAEQRRIPLVMVTQKDGHEEDLSKAEIYELGVIGSITRLLRLPDGTIKMMVEAKRRVCVSGVTLQDGFFSAEAKEIEETVVSSERIVDLLKDVISALTDKRLKIADELNNEILPVSATTDDGAAVISDRIASELRMDLESKQELLETLDPAVRLEKLLAHLRAES